MTDLLISATAMVSALAVWSVAAHYLRLRPYMLQTRSGSPCYRIWAAPSQVAYLERLANHDAGSHYQLQREPVKALLGAWANRAR